MLGMECKIREEEKEEEGEMKSSVGRGGEETQEVNARLEVVAFVLDLINSLHLWKLAWCMK